MFTELRTWLVDAYLEKVDKATMAASLEARVPLLDYRIVEMLALAPHHWKTSGAQTKILLRRLAARYLPRSTAEKPKHGFAPPYERWLRGCLSLKVQGLTSSDAAISGLIDQKYVARVLRGFAKGEPRAAQVWCLLVLELWARSIGRMN